VSHIIKVIAWQYDHDYITKHLILEDAPPRTKIQIKSDWSITITQIFTIGIMQLKDDIQDSIYRHGGYLDQIESNTDNLQCKLMDAIGEIYQY
jgi:hypothetical protein